MFGVYRTGTSGAGDENRSFAPARIAGVIRKRLWLIALIAILLTGTAFALSLTQTPRYEASVRILVGQDRGFTNSPTEAVGLQQLTQTMNVAADSRTVAEAVIEELNLGVGFSDFDANMAVSQIGSTQFIEISYTDPDPATAQRVANALGDEFSDRIDETSNNSNPITATLYDRAAVPDEPASPQPFRNGVLALILGLVFGVAVAFLLEYMDDSWHSPEEAEELVGAPVFGIVPRYVVEDAGDAGGLGPEPGSKNADGEAAPVAVSGGSSEIVRGVAEPESPEVGSLERMIPPAGAALIVGGRFESVGSVFAGIMGRDPDDLVGEEWSTSEFPDEASYSEASYSETSPVQRKIGVVDGREVWVQETVTRPGDRSESLLVVIRDITKEKEAEARIRDLGRAGELSTERLRRFVDHSPVMFQSLTPEGEELAANSAWRDFWRAPSGGEEATNALENETGNMGELPTYVRQSLGKRENVYTPELRIESKNGAEERWVKGYITPVSERDEKVSEVMIFLEDVTPRKAYDTAVQERKRAEELARRSQEKLDTLTTRVTGLLTNEEHDRDDGEKEG